MQQQLLPSATESEIHVPIVRRQEFDTGLLILVKHLQQFIHPELFLDLSTQSPTSSCKYNGLERLSAEALLAGIDNKFLDSNNSVRNLCFLRIRSVELLVL